MGNYLYTTLFEPAKAINDAAFDYSKKKHDYTINALMEIETDDFTAFETIRQKLLALDNENVTHRIDTHIMPGLKHYLHDDSKLYSNKAILSQTDFFIFKHRIPLLCIKNTQAELNREKLGSTDTKNNNVIFVASCDLTKLWGDSAP